MIGWKKQIYNSADGISGHRCCRSLFTSFITPTNITSICHHCHLNCPDQSVRSWRSTCHQVLYTGHWDTWWRVPNLFNHDNYKVALHKMLSLSRSSCNNLKSFSHIKWSWRKRLVAKMHHWPFSLPELAVSLFKTCYWSTHSDSKFMDDMHLFPRNQLYSSVVGSGAKPKHSFLFLDSDVQIWSCSLSDNLAAGKSQPKGHAKIGKT